ncbi:3'-5' exonuclease [Heliorestis acidaminivorans]|uniref:3'-5' exonuclease n=1 Tax=Heliorestis acidaminivorans TaxID=553427 RepID=UPI001A9B8C20|nr:3'-5' exonuclease [Heliorestis acidaminivorans]
MFWRKKRLNVEFNDQIALSTALEDLSFVVFDTETTGFNIFGEDRLIEIGAVHVQNLVVTDNSFRTYVDPKREIPQIIKDLTGIDSAMVANAPDSFTGVESFFRFTEDLKATCLVAHCLPFDLSVLKSELQRQDYEVKLPRGIDTLDLLRTLNRYGAHKDLADYAKECNTPVFERHRALGDALTAAHLFCALLHQLMERGCRSWGDLLFMADQHRRQIAMS